MDRRGLTHDEAVLDLPAFVIGALDPEEAEAVSAHVIRCAMCQEEQARLERTLGLIGTSAPPMEPPPDLRSRVMGQLGESHEQSAESDEITPKPTLSIIRRLTSFGLAAAAVLLVGIFVWAMLLRHDLNQTQGNLDVAMQQKSADTELLARVSRMIPLVADSSPDSYGTLYIGSQSNQALLVVEDLPPTPASEMYQVWLVNGSTRITGGLFTVDHSGSATVMINAPEPLSTYQSLGITSEPAPTGSAAPTGPRVIGCSLK